MEKIRTSPLCADAEALAQALGDLGASSNDTKSLSENEDQIIQNLFDTMSFGCIAHCNF